MQWSVDSLDKKAVGVSASRRTDIPAFFGVWFERRLEAGFVEYIPTGPPRRVRRSIRPESVTHFNFWTKWPRPFFRALERVLAIGYPVLWNVTITGLGGTEVEPHVPDTQKVIDAVIDLAHAVPAAAIQWRYDPLFLSHRFDADHHRVAFARIADKLAGHVDRVTTSPVQVYGRRVRPDLLRYSRDMGDALDNARQLDLFHELQELATARGILFTVCCAPEVRGALHCDRAGCNAWEWASRVYPELQRRRRLRPRPTRTDCACSEEIDIGVYDTCVLGCRYSYGSCNEAKARANLARHDPALPCILPARSESGGK